MYRLGSPRVKPHEIVLGGCVTMRVPTFTALAHTASHNLGTRRARCGRRDRERAAASALKRGLGLTPGGETIVGDSRMLRHLAEEQVHHAAGLLVTETNSTIQALSGLVFSLYDDKTTRVTGSSGKPSSISSRGVLGFATRLCLR